MNKLKVVMIYGEKVSSRNRGPYHVDELYVKKGLTGSESSFFNLARGLQHLGHEVMVLCDCAGPQIHESGFNMFPLTPTLPALPTIPADVVIAWNEPDYLAHAPPDALRMCDQQLNDFGYVENRHMLHDLDVWVAPSQNHLDYLTTREGLGIGKTRVIPNSVDRSLFTDYDSPSALQNRESDRNKRKVVWCSSPDRGLHHLLSFWPEVRRAVPDAELHVFYRLQGWINDVAPHGPWNGAHPDVQESARRARYVDEALRRMKDGYGIVVRDLVPNVEMARELESARLLAYTCDPLRYTEGFGVSTLDAVAAGCRVLISDVDALPSCHGRAVTRVIPGRPDEQRRAWVDGIVACLLEDDVPQPDAAAYLIEHDYGNIAKRWEDLIREQIHFRAFPTPQRTPRLSHPEVGTALRVRQRLAPGGKPFLFWETNVHGSWWSMEDEQNVRDRHWHPGPGDLVVDGGAAFGSYALPALAAGARVVAFSPADPDTELLEANVDLNPEFGPRFMLSRDGLAHADVRFDPNASRYLEPDEPSVPGELRCRALDVWLAEHPEVDRVDWIKLDVEGAELDALKGAEQCLRKWRPNLLIECHDFHRPMQAAVRDYVLGLGLGYTFEAHPHGGVSHAYFEVPHLGQV